MSAQTSDDAIYEPGEERDEDLGLSLSLTVCPWDCQDTPNGFVDIGDMFKLFGHWFAAGPCDFDGNGLGDINDLFAMFGNWGVCP